MENNFDDTATSQSDKLNALFYVAGAYGCKKAKDVAAYLGRSYATAVKVCLAFLSPASPDFRKYNPILSSPARYQKINVRTYEK